MSRPSVTDTLLAIFSTHLGGQEVGLDDDFYGMGGDSLIALRVITDAQQNDISITLLDLLYNPTVRGLVESAGQAHNGGAARLAVAPYDQLPFSDVALMPPGVGDALPASALQIGMIYLCEASGDPELYHALIGWEVVADFREDLFRDALADLCARHEALRTSFDLGTFSVALQLRFNDVEPSLSVDRLPHADAGRANELVDGWRERQRTLPIDWRRPPLFRCHVVAQPDCFVVTLAMHHAIVDGWSYARLIVDLLTLYDARLRGQTAALPALPTAAHRAFIAAEQEQLASVEAGEHWLGQADVPALLFDPTTIRAVANASALIDVPLDATLLKQLRGAARQVGVPLKSIALATHAWALSRWAGRSQDVVTGVVVNTRPERAGFDLVVGLYLNTVPIRFPTLEGTWADLAVAAFASERAGSPYRGYPLALVEGRLGRPAFDVSFNFMNFHIYEDLQDLSGMTVRSWWISGKPSFPFRVDFAVDSFETGSHFFVGFDLALVSEQDARRYADLHLEALVATAADPLAQASARGVQPSTNSR